MVQKFELTRTRTRNSKLELETRTRRGLKLVTCWRRDDVLCGSMIHYAHRVDPLDAVADMTTEGV